MAQTPTSLCLIYVFWALYFNFWPVCQMNKLTIISVTSCYSNDSDVCITAAWRLCCLLLATSGGAKTEWVHCRSGVGYIKLIKVGIPPSRLGISAPHNTWFLGRHTRILNPNGLTCGSAVFAEVTVVTNTDRPRYDVSSNSPHLALLVVLAMRATGPIAATAKTSHSCSPDGEPI